MNNEINEILNRLFVFKNENDEMKYQPEDILTIDDVWLLLDYITNLQEENERLNNVKNDLLYVLEQLDGYLDKGWTIDLNFTDIREKYKEDIKEYENWK